MRSALLILLLSWTYAGCSSVSPATRALPDSRGGAVDVVRILAGEPAWTAAVERAAVALPLLPGGLLQATGNGRRWARPDDHGCVRLQLRDVTWPGGRTVRAEDLVAAWERGLREGSNAHVWLLAPLAGAQTVARGLAEHASGLAVEGDRVRLCTERPTPDLAERLEHPALWLARTDPVTRRVEGPGPFAPALEAGAFVRRSASTNVTRVELVGGAGVAELFAAERIDFAVVDGRAAAELSLRRPDDVRAVRLPTWDRAYALSIDPSARWVNDPRFRRWLAAAIDRRALLDVVFAGRGRPVSRLLGDETVAAPGEEDRAPFDPASRPRLVLAFDGRDPSSARVAARLKAELEQRGLRIVLESRIAGPGRGVAGAAALVLIVHRPPVSDPVLALLDTLWPLSSAVADAIERLDRGSRVEAPAARFSAAERAETLLLDDARLVPLVRVHAWQATHRSLQGVNARGWGVLELGAARWER